LIWHDSEMIAVSAAGSRSKIGLVAADPFEERARRTPLHDLVESRPELAPRACQARRIDDHAGG
jgi:hypothetical protein